ncbi:MAG TPA: hypothetical protein V6D19_14720 [Stenomitos sp.]
MKSKPSLDLNQFSNYELLVLEDKLLLQNELASEPFALFSHGRRVITFLGFFCFLLYLLALNPIFDTLSKQGNPLAIFLYVGCLCAGILSAQAFWERMGCYPRVMIRTALHYWPVTLTLIGYLVYGIKV